jgi:glycosyltransferase involved in cell wall biosynthesis
MKLSLYGVVNCLSYGNVTTNLTDALTKLGHEVQLFPINEHNVECEPQYRESVEKSLKLGQFFRQNMPAVKIWHQWQMGLFPQNSLRCGFSIFELDNLTPLERHNLNSLDLLFVCTQWAKEVIKKNDITTPTRVVPLGVDLEVFIPPTTSPKVNKTIFLSVGKWEYRKGHDVLIKGFNQAFGPKDNVELWMVCDNPFLTPDGTRKWLDIYKGSHIGDKIKVVSRLKSQADLCYIMGQAHFMVSPSRAEGWNLPLLEGMACGLPCITTAYSGHTEFCTHDNSLLIQPTNLEEANDGIWFKPGGAVNSGNWMAFETTQVEQLVEHFRQAHKLNSNNLDALAEMKKQCLETAKKFTWKNSAQILMDNLLRFV